MVLPGCDTAAAMNVGERLRTSVSVDPFILHDDTLIVTLSLGIATLAPDGSSDLIGTARTHLPLQESLIHAADLALYQAKEDGRNRISASTFALPAL